MEILKTNSKDYLTQIKKVNKIEDCIYGGSPSLISISKNIHENSSVGYIALLLTEINMELNIGKGMNEAQIISASREILREYYYLNLSEIVFCLREGKLGKYGKIYDRLDVQIIFEWLEKYTIERSNISIRENSNNKLKYQNDFNEIILPVLKKVIDDQEKPEIKENPKRDKSMYYDFHQKQMVNFDKLRKKFNADSSERFIKRYNRILNVESFVNYKVDQLMRVRFYLDERNKDLL